MRAWFLRLLPVLLWTAVAGGPSPASAGDSGKDRARQHYRKATQFYDIGRWDEAIAEYEKAYALHEDPSLLFNMAQTLRRKGDLRRALDVYKNYLVKAPESPLRGEVEDRIRTLKVQVEQSEQQQSNEAQKPALLVPPPVVPLPPAAGPTPQPPLGTPALLAPAAAASQPPAAAPALVQPPTAARALVQPPAMGPGPVQPPAMGSWPVQPPAVGPGPVQPPATARGPVQPPPLMTGTPAASPAPPAAPAFPAPPAQPPTAPAVAPAAAVVPVPPAAPVAYPPTGPPGPPPAVFAPPTSPPPGAPASAPIGVVASQSGPPPAPTPAATGSSGLLLLITGAVLTLGGVASLGAGVYYGVETKLLSNRVSTARKFSPSDDTAGKNAQKLQWVYGIIGATATVAGTVLYAIGEWQRDSHKSRVTVAPQIQPNGAMLAATGAF